MEKKPNRLINEKSPYLIQHAYNPVDWYPWCDDAFEKAKNEDKPIFLSIGYSTCHWCHVMEKESFEDKEIASILNRHFVCIKVDREERPDLDNIYMNICIMFTGSGGWPLTIFITPDKKPFFAGTYFPKNTLYGRIGLKDLLINIATLWQRDRKRLLKNSEILITHLNHYVSSSSREDLAVEILDSCYKNFKDTFDSKYGGFGHRPKFPSPHNFLYLLRYYYKKKDPKALYMVEKSLKNMRLGGIFDHVGYGFHRYSTDERWVLPHFEKMLYDQALLSIAYSEAYQLTKDPFYKRVVKEVLDYVDRDMRDEKGGFFSSEDADSEGEEGKFYVWSFEELEDILGDKFCIFKKVFKVKKDGNYLEEATLLPTGKNILYMEKDYKNLSKELGVSEERLVEKIENMRRKLFKIREKRIHPLKDKKILTDWNGLMIAAFSIGSQVLGEERYGYIARKCADFILSNMKTSKGLLLHRYKDGEVKFYSNLEDYAFLVWGLIELYHTIFEEKYLKEAILLTDKMVTHFWDSKNGGFFMTPDFGESLFIRPKEGSDGAIPSGNSVAAYNLFKLNKITGKKEYREYGIETIESFASKIKKSPTFYSMMLIGFDFLISEGIEVVLTGNNKIAMHFFKEIYKHYLPHKIVLFKRNETLSEIAPYTDSIPLRSDKTNAYICKNFSCGLPVNNLEEFKKLLHHV